MTTWASALMAMLPALGGPGCDEPRAGAAQDLISAVPRGIECPEPLRRNDDRMLLDLHPDRGADEASHCRRADGVRQGPAVAWWFGRKKLAQIGFYCDGDAQGRWSFFWRNGVLAREGSFAGPSRKIGTWTDWDDKGRKLRETEYVDGKEVARRELVHSGPVTEPDPMAVDAAAAERFADAVRQTCAATPVGPRPFLGLRAELNAAGAVVRIRVTDTQVLDRPPGSDWALDPPARQQIDALVRNVLAGSVAEPGRQVRLSFAKREYLEQGLHLSGFETLPGVSKGDEATALVLRTADGLRVVMLMRASELERTDAFFAEYARLARLDDRAFALGLARHLADRILLLPDRLLWVNWANLAFDDWDRLRVATPPTEPGLRRLASQTHQAVLRQIDRFVRSGEGGVNLYELPWLIRLLSPGQRRDMAKGLLRLHPAMAEELEEAGKAQALTARRPDPRAELTIEDVRAMGADANVMHLVHCLAVCLDPLAPRTHPREEVLRRARQFARER